MSRLPYFTLLSIFVLLSCGGKNSPPGPSAGEGAPSGGGTNTNAPSAPLGRPSQPGGHFLQDFPLNLVVEGGVSKDGIPALTDPLFDSAPWENAGYLLDSDLVLGVVINGEAKAYPHNIGWHHEIVNDVVGDRPVIVTFCPLTGTGMVFDGRGGNDIRITVGVSGLLFNNNLIMYDRRDDKTLYPQMIFTGVQGPKAGHELELLPVVETTWGYWKRLYPDTKVVSVTGESRVQAVYTTYPYDTYRSADSEPLFPTFPELEKNATGRLFGPKEITLGVRFGETAKAYPFPVMGNDAVINDTVAGNPIVVVYYAREQLAIPYSRTVATRTLTFERVSSTDSLYPFMLKDKETGTVWGLKGEAIAGPLRGERLEQVPAHNAFWFAWATFWQNTGIY